MSIDDQFSKRDEAILTMRAMVFATTMAVRSSLTDEQIEKRRALLDLAQIKP